MSRRPGTDGSAFDEVADALYGLAPADFVAARQEAVARAKGAGDRALADSISALRRPTMAAHALNLLARARPEQVEHLRELGRGLRDAQSRLQGSRLRELAAQRNALVAALTDQARRVADQAGQPVGDQAAAEVDQTLRAVLADEQAAEAFAAGRLTQALVPGMALPDLPASAAPESQATPARRPSARRPAASGTGRPDPDEARRRRLAEAEQSLRERETEQRAADEAVGPLRAAAERGAEELQAAAERTACAEQELAHAREALTAAEERSTAAQAAAAAAERDREQARLRVDEQRAVVDGLRRG